MRTVHAPFAALIALSLFAPGSRALQGLPDPFPLTILLHEVVRSPGVDYPALVERRAELEAFLGALNRVTEADLASAPRPDRLAFWINAYNACMLRRVVDHFPLGSGPRPSLSERIRNRLAGRPESSVWQIPEVFTGAFCPVAGALRSLDEIEHSILRPMGEPRIHFAINCAARSCPPLHPDAYEGDRLESQLDERVRAFLVDPGQFSLERDGARVVVRTNPILNWFGEDFGGDRGVLDFLARYSVGTQRALLSHPDTGIEFFPYDWTLNEAAP